MKPVEHDVAGDFRETGGCTSQDWTGEHDMIAAITLVVCLGLASLVFLLLAAIELSP